MSTLDLDKMGLQELNAKEMVALEGGFPFWIIPVSIYLYDNRDRFAQGIKDGIADIL